MKYSFFKKGSYTFFTKAAICEGGLDYPKMLNIEPTNECNFNCVMCSRQHSRRPVGTMSMDLFTSIIDDVVKCAKTIKWLTLHNDGEPLLHPGISRMVTYAKKSKAVEYVHFNTNGQLLDEENAVSLIEAGLDDLTVSIDAFSKETFRTVKRAGNFDRVVANIIQLMQLKRKFGKANPWVRAKIIDMPLTQKELNAFVEFWQSKVDEVQIQPVHNAAGAMNISDRETRSQRYPCSLLWYSLTVNWDGTVTTCCVDLTGENIIGDLNKTSLQNIFINKKINAYRKKMLNGLEQDLTPCNLCDVWKNGINLFDSRLEYKHPDEKAKRTEKKDAKFNY